MPAPSTSQQCRSGVTHPTQRDWILMDMRSSRRAHECPVNRMSSMRLCRRALPCGKYTCARGTLSGARSISPAAIANVR